MAGQEWVSTPYESDPLGGEFEQKIETAIAGGVIVTASIIDSPAGVHPALTFRFVKVDNTYFVPMTLIVDDKAMREFAKLVNNAAADSVRGADKKRREQRRGNTGNKG